MRPSTPGSVPFWYMARRAPFYWLQSQAIVGMALWPPFLADGAGPETAVL